MTFQDDRWGIWDNQALTVTEESRTNGEMKDLEEFGTTDESISDKLWFNLMVGTAFGGLAEGCYFTVITSDSPTFSTGSGGEQSIMGFGSEDYPLLIAQLTAGARFSIACSKYNLHKYLEVVFVAVSSAANAGNVDAWFGMESLSPPKLQKSPS